MKIVVEITQKADKLLKTNTSIIMSDEEEIQYEMAGSVIYVKHDSLVKIIK